MYVQETVLGCGQDLYASGQGLVAGSWEHGNDPLGYMKGKEFLDQLNYCSYNVLCSVKLIGWLVS